MTKSHHKQNHPAKPHEAHAVPDGEPTVEQHAEPVVEPVAEPVGGEAAQASTDGPRGFVHAVEVAAKKRLQGTKAEKVLVDLTGRVGKELDVLLDRVGLVRKSRMPLNKHDDHQAA